MARLSAVIMAACAAILSGSAGHAQQPPTSASPPPPAYGAAITLDQARAAIAAGQTEMKKNGWNQVVAVVGPAGNLIALEKVDLAANASIDIAQDKARSSALFRIPTKVYQDRLTAGETYVLGLRGAVPVAGGMPIIVGGQVIGAVGVSGGTALQDHQVAQAAAAAVK